MLGHRFDQRPVLIHQSIQSTSDVVAVRVALAVLHVADKSICPVTEPQRPIGTDLRIGWSEMLIRRLDQIVR